MVINVIWSQIDLYIIVKSIQLYLLIVPILNKYKLLNSVYIILIRNYYLYVQNHMILHDLSKIFHPIISFPWLNYNMNESNEWKYAQKYFLSLI